MAPRIGVSGVAGSAPRVRHTCPGWLSREAPTRGDADGDDTRCKGRKAEDRSFAAGEATLYVGCGCTLRAGVAASERACRCGVERCFEAASAARLTAGDKPMRS